jgi:hypothetical protein
VLWIILLYRLVVDVIIFAAKHIDFTCNNQSPV